MERRDFIKSVVAGLAGAAVGVSPDAACGGALSLYFPDGWVICGAPKWLLTPHDGPCSIYFDRLDKANNVIGYAIVGYDNQEQASKEFLALNRRGRLSVFPEDRVERTGEWVDCSIDLGQGGTLTGTWGGG